MPLTAGSNRLEAWLTAHEHDAGHLLCHSGIASAPFALLPPEASIPDWGAGTIPHDPGLGQDLADLYGVQPDEVAVTIGASEADLLVVLATVSPGDRVLVERPTYPPMLQAMELLGARVDRLDRTASDGFAVDVDAVATSLEAGARLVVLTDLHNPSGATIPDATLRHVGDLCEDHGAWCLVDEIFHELALEPRATARTVHPRIVATNSLTKVLGLSGVRTGWVLGDPSVVARVIETRPVTTGASAPWTQAVARNALARRDALLARGRAIRDANLPRLRAAVQASPLTWTEPMGGVVCAPRLPPGWDDVAFAEALLAEADVLVVPGSYLELPGHLRVGFGTEPDAFEAALAAFASFLETYEPDP